MQDFAVLLAHVRNVCVPDGAGVGRLPASFGEEHGPVEDHVEPVLRRSAGDDEGFRLG